MSCYKHTRDARHENASQMSHRLNRLRRYPRTTMFRWFIFTRDTLMLPPDADAIMLMLPLILRLRFRRLPLRHLRCYCWRYFDITLRR